MSSMNFYFFPGSTYTYLTVNRIDAKSAEAGVEVRWRPYELRTVVRENGTSPFFPAGSPKRRYMWRDIERRAKRYGLSFVPEPPHPIDPELLTLRVSLVAAAQGWCPEFTKAHYKAWFEDHQPSCDEMDGFLRRIGRDPSSVLPRAMSQEITTAIEESVDEARSLGLFGSPHFVVAGEVFWGDDRLEEALEWAVASEK